MRNVLFFALLALAVIPGVSSQSYGIPGTTQTLAGYDTELGEDPICWRSNGTNSAGAVGVGRPFPNPLVRDFVLQGSVELLQECPSLNTLTATAPEEFQRGERLRSGQPYNYTVSVTLNLASLGGSSNNTFTSDSGAVVAIQILVCQLGGGFCSPFIHEESNARLESLGITTSPETGDSHGGTHTHSEYVYVAVPLDQGPVYTLTETVNMLVNDPGEYFAIASIQMYVDMVDNSTNATATTALVWRYDMANALATGQRLITYQEPANILQVSDAVLLVSYVAIGIVGSIILFLLVETVKNRNHQVLRLTQGSFLIVFLLAALTAVVSSFLLNPRNDFYCQAGFPIMVTSAHLLYAITLGRLWRIHAVISPLLMDTLRHQEKGMAESVMARLGRIVTFRWKKPADDKAKKLRRQITSRQLALFVALIMLPQVVVQVCSLIFQPQSFTIEYNVQQSTGRTACDDGVHVGKSLRYWGFWLFLLLVLLLLAMASSTSQLPSLFNETRIIYESAAFTVTLMTLGLAVLIVKDDPTTTPAVSYMVFIIWSLSIALNTSLRIMLPKLRMVWRNETVIVSRLVSDHAKTLRGKRTVPGHQISGLVPPARHDTGNGSVRRRWSLRPALNQSAADKECSLMMVRRDLPNRIVVASEVAPSRILTLKLVDLKEQLSEVTYRICSGVAVSEEEWTTLRTLTEKLGTAFADDVQFEWEENSDLEHGRSLAQVPTEVPARESSVRFDLGTDDNVDGEDCQNEV